jgi:hypothetical protein
MAAIKDHWLMKAAHLCHSTEAGQPIGDHFTPSSQGILSLVFYWCKGKGFILGQPRANGVTSLIKGDCGANWHLVLCTANWLVTIALSTQVSIIQLNLYPQHIGLLPLTHRLHNLVAKQPCSTIIYGQFSDKG